MESGVIAKQPMTATVNFINELLLKEGLRRYLNGNMYIIHLICRSGSTRDEDDDGQDEIFLPLTDSEGKLLPVHFLNCEELGHEEAIMQQWMLTCSTGGGLLVARQRTRQRPLLVAQMLEEWLNHYRRIA